MGYLIFEQEIVNRLEGTRESVEIRDTIGRVIGVFHPTTESISDEYRAELESLRKDRSGKRMDEVLAGLKRK